MWNFINILKVLSLPDKKPHALSLENEREFFKLDNGREKYNPSSIVLQIPDFHLLAFDINFT